MSTIKTILFSFFLFFPATLIGQQTDTFLDIRDNTEYTTIKIGEAIWFQENLKYQTPDCFCQGKNLKKEICQLTNYYPNYELKDVCPTNWHIATLSDWKTAVNYLIKNQEIEQNSIHFDTIENGTVSIIFDRLQLMGDHTFFNFQDIGWVQGKKHRPKQNTTLWIYNETTRDNRFHIHYGNKGYVEHAHAHNIDGPKRKRRRFSVRCLKNH